MHGLLLRVDIACVPSGSFLLLHWNAIFNHFLLMLDITSDGAFDFKQVLFELVKAEVRLESLQLSLTNRQFIDLVCVCMHTKDKFNAFCQLVGHIKLS